ncbi:unnamed protein product, partial [Ceratitis capitata]
QRFSLISLKYTLTHTHPQTTRTHLRIAQPDIGKHSASAATPAIFNHSSASSRQTE